MDEELFEEYKRDFSEDTLDDLALQKDPTDVSITEVLAARYNKDQIYTYLGNTIVSVNPYKKTSLYRNETKRYYHTKHPYEIAPHLYSLVEDAYRTMRETGQPQTVIISGESGAGKTESAKKIMEYIAAVSIGGLVTDNIKQILLESNPVLEAFGNAKTLRNDNSSPSENSSTCSLTSKDKWKEDT